MRLVSVFLASIAVLAGGLVLAGPAQAACALSAVAPNSNNNGYGTRGQTCSGTVTFTVKVKKDRSFQIDPTVGYSTKTGFKNGTLWANGDCSGGSGSYYTEAITSTPNSVQSNRVGRC